MCEALGRGLPVVTRPGAMFCSRPGLSLLRTIGARDGIADSEASYIGLAVRPASDRDRLRTLRGADLIPEQRTDAAEPARPADLRTRLRASPLCDGAGFTRGFENALEQIRGQA